MSPTRSTKPTHARSTSVSPWPAGPTTTLTVVEQSVVDDDERALELIESAWKRHAVNFTNPNAKSRFQANNIDRARLLAQTAIQTEIRKQKAIEKELHQRRIFVDKLNRKLRIPHVQQYNATLQILGNSNVIEHPAYPSLQTQCRGTVVHNDVE